MKYFLYCVYDTKLAEAMAPLAFQSEEHMQRTLGDIVNYGDESHPWKRHTEDYIINIIGTWDSNTGQVTPLDIQQVQRLDALKR